MCPQFVAANDYFYAFTFSYFVEFSAIWQQCLFRVLSIPPLPPHTAFSLGTLTGAAVRGQQTHPEYTAYFRLVELTTAI